MRSLLPLLLLPLTACAGPQTLYVEPAPDGEWDDPAAMAIVERFTTIQDAIDTAVVGDTVEIPAGTYNEMVELTPGIALHGAGQGQTIVNGRIRLLGGTGGSISSLTVVCVPSVGVHIESNDGGTVSDVEVTGCSAGVLLEDNAANTVLDGLYLHGNTFYGVELQMAMSVTLTNSLLQSNGRAGVYSEYTFGGLIAHNTIVGNGFSGSSTPRGGLALTPNATESRHNNIITGNLRGIDCDSCGGPSTSNLVWGNTVDYASEASAAASDLSGDPGFANPTEGDYHLAAGSIAIDAGDPSITVLLDADGEARPQGSAPDLGMDEFIVSTWDLVITEVMADPLVESTGEFVELWNAGGTSVELAGLVLDDGDRTDVLVAYGTSGTVLGPDERAVVLDSQYAGQYVIDASVPLLTTSDTTLGNGLTVSDLVTLRESDGLTVIATASYPSSTGNGISLELADEVVGDVAGNWRASQCTSGSSPGDVACFPEAGDPSVLVITEVLANALVESTGEFVELWNPGPDPVDAAGLVLSDGDSTDVLVAFGGGSALIDAGLSALILDPDFDWSSTLPPGVVLLTTDDATLGNGLSNADPIELLLPDGVTLIDSFSFPTDPGDGVSWERVDVTAGDVASNWVAGDAGCATGSSPGRLNGAAGGACGPILIEEVMANPLVEATGEFVELLNAGLGSVDLLGLLLDDGDVAEPIVTWNGGGSVLGPGERGVVVDSGWQGAPAIPSGVVIVTTTNATLGNGLSVSDTIRLLEADGSVIDGWDWPFNPGNGVSVERLWSTGAPIGPEAWDVSTCAAGGSPGAANCATTGQAGGTGSAADLVITEVMSNPATESTGEYVELWNAGVDPVDLAGMVLWDGDSADPLEGYLDPTDTVLPAGAWAVVLDADYAGQYSIPGAALLLTTDDSALGSGLAQSDPVTLLEADGATVIDTFSFPGSIADGVPWERLDVSVGDVASNWAAASCGPTPGSANCP